MQLPDKEATITIPYRNYVKMVDMIKSIEAENGVIVKQTVSSFETYYWFKGTTDQLLSSLIAKNQELQETVNILTNEKYKLQYGKK